ncbi:MAG: DUF1653 domain-containing protein [Atopobiaceae bacterium]
MSKKDVVCGCKHVTKADIEAAVAAGATTYEEVRRQTGAGSKCGKCKKRVQKVIAKAIDRQQKAAKKDAEAKTKELAGAPAETEGAQAPAKEAHGQQSAPLKLHKPTPSHLAPSTAAVPAPQPAAAKPVAPPSAESQPAASKPVVAKPTGAKGTGAKGAQPFAAVSAESPLASAAGRTLQIHGIYRHFKGNCYLVEDVARNSENGEEYVVYRKLYGDGSLWIRPKKMFLSPVDRQKYPDATQKWRFELQRVSSVAR